MYDCKLFFRSLTAAQLAQAACRQRGIWSQVVRAPAAQSGQGCGFALQVGETDFGYVQEILRAERLSYQRAECRQGVGW